MYCRNRRLLIVATHAVAVLSDLDFFSNATLIMVFTIFLQAYMKPDSYTHAFMTSQIQLSDEVIAVLGLYDIPGRAR